jgi:hypothetical protein
MKNNQPKSKKPGTAVAKVSPPTQDQQRSGINATSGLFNGTGVMAAFQKNLAGEGATPDTIFMALEEKLDLVKAGDLTPVESMLFSQAAALQTIFASLARRTTQQEYLKQYQTYLTLALKAQAQSRATLEALIELKQPRHAPTFVKQANIANGPQQVNNGTAPNYESGTRAYAHAHGDTQNAQNRLLEDQRDGSTYLEHGATGAAAGGHQAVAALGAVHRADQPGGQGKG